MDSRSKTEIIKSLIATELDRRREHDIEPDRNLKNITIMVFMDKRTGRPSDVRFRKESYQA
jgi:hypothetical protein